VAVPLTTRILLADDHAVVRRGLRMVLEAQPDLTVVAEAGDGIEAVERGLREPVDLAVIDVAMPKRTGLDAARELLRHRPDMRILMLSMHDVEEFCFRRLRRARPATCSRPRPTRSSSTPAAPRCAASPSSRRRRSRR